jgi:hypothetical protein
MKTIIVTLLLSLPLLAETVVSGIMLQNEWWSEKNSPYIITNDIIIGPNARLVIEPGVTVFIEKPTTIPEGIDQFDALDSVTVSIRVLGSIYWRGLPQKPLEFKPRYNDGDEFSRWYGVILNSNRSEEISIEYATFTGAAQAINIQKGMPFIRNSIFMRNSIGLKCEGKSTARVVQSIFYENFLAGVRVNDANPYLYNNIIAFNRTNGIWSDNHSELIFEYNCVFGNEARNYRECDPLYGLNSKTNTNGDSVDFAFNLAVDPLFVGSTGEKVKIDKLRKELIESTLKKPDKKAILNLDKATAYKAEKKFELSRFSPCLNAGNRSKKFREPDGSYPDLGIWGGAEFLELRK